MTPTTRLGRSWGRVAARVGDASRRGARRWRDRRRPRLAVPPPTPVEVSAADGVVELRLAGGDRRNVLGRETIARIEEVVANPPAGARVIVITAEPPDFSAGYDLLEASRTAPSSLIAHEGNFAALRSSRLPVVVALSGNVIGGGLELALLGDVRVATPDTRFSIPASRMGLVYSESGTRLVVDTFGASVARSMFLSAATVSCETALSLGVVSLVVGREQLRAQALATAREIASWPEVATSGNRQVLDVVTGRAAWDAVALREASFAPRGALEATIQRFVERRARRAGTAPDVSAEPYVESGARGD
ncbi:MAG TPA: enoyl-CoA hydratase/isomerase family protein [Acidimicrobiales bacterium]|nr:MAG: hypothetical protein B7Z69_09650 [Actinobacteria bacterium 21-73-9]HQU26787.1 enoyl-CoA hydratase/isomerase family protein [Acidimicrobiales bacterium]